MTDWLLEGKKVFEKEIRSLELTKEALDDTFLTIAKLISKCEGKVVLTGMGKPGHVAKKLAATFSSLGTPAFALHPAEAMHGDLGMISSNDIVIAISYSGESSEILGILPAIKNIGAQLVAITGNGESTLAKQADFVQVLPEIEEACHLGLAPSSSTTVEMCYGDALAIVVSQMHGFQDVDFGKYHPAGALGRKLLIGVKDIMAEKERAAVVSPQMHLKDAIVELSRKGLGAVAVVDGNRKTIGIITDGNLRRLLERGADIYQMSVADAMTENPIAIASGKLAIEALLVMKQRNISCLIVEQDGNFAGIIRMQDVVGAGIWV